MARKKAQRGYTVVEVMMALAVLTLGASGVIAMQKATLIANTNARNLATATALAQSWVEKLRADILRWNEQAGTADLSDTAWITAAATSAPTSGGGWFTPNITAYGGSQPTGAPNFDVMGGELHAGDTAALLPAFCTQIRLTRFSTQTSSPLYRLVRIEVRVRWDRRGGDCTLAPANWDTEGNTQDRGVGRWGTVYLVSAAMENKAPY
jgi:type IV pilus assembly protein PilV